MEENKVKLAETIRSIITNSPLYEQILSELKGNMYQAKVFITPQNGVQVDIAVSVPKWNARFGASHPVNGALYFVHFEDGNHGMINANTDNTFDPVCKRTERYKGKTFFTIDDAVEALYASIMEFGIQKLRVTE